MRAYFRKLTGFLARNIGRHYFIEVEENETGKKFRIVVRALTARSAIQGGFNYCGQKNKESGKDYELSAIYKI